MADDQALAVETAESPPETARIQPQRRPEKGGDAPGQYIGSEVAGRLLMLSGERIRQLSGEGWIRKIGHDQYTLVDVVQGYIRFRDDSERKANERRKGDRVVNARARELELRIAEREGRVIDVDEAMTLIEQLCGLFRTELSGLPASTTRDLSLRRELEQRCNAVCDRIATVAAQRAARMAKGGGADAALAADAALSLGDGEPDVSKERSTAGAA